MNRQRGQHATARVALVSSGSRGIGAATVRKLAADGWDIAFSHADDGPAAREVEKDAWELGVRVSGTDVDLTDAGEVGSWFELTESELGPIRAVVCCAGLTREQPLPRVPGEEWRILLDTSLHGVFHLCRTAVFTMMRRREGQIVAVSSVCGEYDHTRDGNGILTRPGVEGFTRALASQARRYGISVNAVTPGQVTRIRDAGILVPEQGRPDLAETIALRRFSSAAGVAGLVSSLLSAEGPPVTGRVLEVSAAISF